MITGLIPNDLYLDERNKKTTYNTDNMGKLFVTVFELLAFL